jgi:hypothetical protein
MARRTRTAVALALVAALAVPLAAPSGAAAKPVKTCVKKKTGAMRVVKKNKRCKRGERKLVLQTKGKRGKRGKQGKTGARGQQGPAGPRGLQGTAGAGFAGPAGGALTGTYPNPQIGTGAVTGPSVLDDALGGADIDESALGRVPDASLLDGLDSTAFLPLGATAANSQLLDGVDSGAFLQKIAEGSTPLDFGGLNSLTCSVAKVATTTAHGTAVLVNNPYDTLLTGSMLAVSAFRVPNGAGDDVVVKTCNLNPIAGINPASQSFAWALVG